MWILSLLETGFCLRVLLLAGRACPALLGEICALEGLRLCPPWPERLWVSRTRILWSIGTQSVIESVHKVKAVHVSSPTRPRVGGRRALVSNPRPSSTFLILFFRSFFFLPHVRRSLRLLLTTAASPCRWAGQRGPVGEGNAKCQEEGLCRAASLMHAVGESVCLLKLHCDVVR